MSAPCWNVECAECGWSDNGHLELVATPIGALLYGDEGRMVLECGHCGEWLDKDNVNRRVQVRVWDVHERIMNEWRWVNPHPSEASAIHDALQRRAIHYRPVCVAPRGVDPDVAYPEAAR